MSANKELDEVTANFTKIINTAKQHHDDLSHVSQRYIRLAEDYKRLRRHHEEDQMSGDKNEHTAENHEDGAFALVLVDGDGYVFTEDLISDGAEGGEKAAQLLQDAVRSCLSERGLGHCDIMTRIYVNLAGISKALSKMQLLRPDQRRLAPFVTRFNWSNALFDIIDVGPHEGSTRVKIQAIFKRFAKITQGAHIYIACCHDVNYISNLSTYHGDPGHITLIQTYATHHDFSKLGFSIEELPGIFRSSPAEMTVSADLSPDPFHTAPRARSDSHSATICLYHQKGICVYGSSCRNLHLKKSDKNKKAAYNDLALRSLDGRQESTTAMSSTTSSFAPHDGTNKEISRNGTSALSDLIGLHIDAAPYHSNDTSTPGIHVNEEPHRLDAPLPFVPSEDRTEFRARVTNHQLCNTYHIRGRCTYGTGCSYDHTPLSPSLLKCLKRMLLTTPCTWSGACRSAGCFYGHMCQNKDCQYRGGTAVCRFDEQGHNQSLQVAAYVPALGFDNNANSDRSEQHRSEEGNSEADSASVYYDPHFSLLD